MNKLKELKWIIEDAISDLEPRVARANFLLFVVKLCIKEIDTFHFAKHTWFTQDTILTVSCLDKDGNRWDYAFGKIKEGTKIFYVNGKPSHLDGLGGQSWNCLCSDIYYARCAGD